MIELSIQEMAGRPFSSVMARANSVQEFLPYLFLPATQESIISLECCSLLVSTVVSYGRMHRTPNAKSLDAQDGERNGGITRQPRRRNCLYFVIIDETILITLSGLS